MLDYVCVILNQLNTLIGCDLIHLWPLLNLKVEVLCDQIPALLEHVHSGHLEQWMFQSLLCGESLTWVLSQQTLYQLLEIFIPIKEAEDWTIKLQGLDLQALVDFLVTLQTSELEWKLTGQKIVHDDACCILIEFKDVYLSPLKDFWRCEFVPLDRNNKF